MEALALGIPLVVLLFAAVYRLVDLNAPGSYSEALSRTDALYFSVTVVSTSASETSWHAASRPDCSRRGRSR
ncbi:hypothetical protein [Streptomyces sp. NPDC051704]|uniref:hypothetical protein n=1 Tax=Streptomyces sp. NPDC051704 TaxID=3365671 RepID=UPI0037B57C46